MNNLLNKEDKILFAGGNGLAGNAILICLKKSGYGIPKNGGVIFTPRRQELNYLNAKDVDSWIKKNEPSVVIVAAGKVGGIHANMTSPSEFLLENLKIELNLIVTSWKYGVRRLLFLGSSCIYPKDLKKPIKENQMLKGALEKTN